uniref:Uncharacterized WD repeat-containing protein C2A9.03-like n=1 Tax=Tanacetum cinerariifolium TaxID=118510 RepID=A0A6L2MRB9_TANCI|nr:uncharacterized WD repeat-containing protein C2A9.03-like [Tanacetum cinerariifolium]
MFGDCCRWNHPSSKKLCKSLIHIISQYHDDDGFMADEYEMEDLDDTMMEELYGRYIGSDYYMLKKFENTTAAHVRRGKTIQGTPWKSLKHH